MIYRDRWMIHVLLMLSSSGLFMTSPAFGESLEAIQALYRSDIAFPEYIPLWWEGWPWTDESGNKVIHAYEGMPLGGYLHIYFRNTTDRPIEISDILINGVSVSKIVVPEDPQVVKPLVEYASSIQFSTLGAHDIERITQAGEPVWWKVDPAVVPPGSMAEATVRLRRDPVPKQLDVKVVAATSTCSQTVATREPTPRFWSISFSPNLDRMYAYLRHHTGRGVSPIRILVDGRDLTAQSTIAADASIATVPVIIDLPRPTIEAEFHCIQAIYSDGSQAIASIRAWSPEYRYGMWGYPRPEETPNKTARNFLTKMNRHQINTLMWSWGQEVADLAVTEDGAKFMKQMDVRLMSHVPGHFDNLLYGFLMDEPDAADYRSTAIDPPGKRLGSLAQCLVAKNKHWRKMEPRTLQLLNVDATFEPEQYYTYAQLPDIACLDRYYSAELQNVYYSHPADLNVYTKPLSVYAGGEIMASAAAPKPVHMILLSAVCGNEERPFRIPLPEEKRVEVYYTLASGAKGISYWWYTSSGGCPGLGSGSPEATALMTEIGILGAEVRTAGPVLSRSFPAKLRVDASRHLWTRCLIAGDDTVVLIAVNDNIAFDRVGAVIQPIDKARAAITTPAWLDATDVFEITCKGTSDIPWDRIDSGVSMKLGRVNLTRLILVTADATLRSCLQERYRVRFDTNVRSLLAAQADRP